MPAEFCKLVFSVAEYDTSRYPIQQQSIKTMKSHAFPLMFKSCALSCLLLLTTSFCASANADDPPSVSKLVSSLSFPPPVSEPASGPSLLRVFTPSSAAPVGNFTLTTTTDLDLSGSMWNRGLDENAVYHAALKHQQQVPGASDRDWEIRVGAGGQIYSLRDELLGELVPPQLDRFPFNDEVFQVICVNTSTRQTGPNAEAAFYHQSGYYAFGHANGAPRNDSRYFTTPVYSPLLSSGAAEADSYSTLCLAVQANPTHTPQIPSGLLNYQRTRSLGDGVIEITYVIYNFGDTTVDFHNMPWGGVRKSKLDNMLVSNPGGGFSEHRIRDFGDFESQVIDARNMGGWAAFAEGVNGADRGLAYVFGFDDAVRQPWQRSGSSWRWGDARGDSENRNFNVGTFRRVIDIAPGDLFESRYFMVLGDVDHIESTINQQGLVAAATYDMIQITEQDGPPTLCYQIQTNNGGVGVRLVDTSEPHDFKTYAHPVQGSKPLFLFADGAGNQFLSVDPYALSDLPYDGITNYQGILGFVLPANIAQGAGPYVDLETLFPADFYLNTDPRTTIMALNGTLLGDFDFDSDVDLADLDQYNGNLGVAAVGDLAALDLNGNGTVDSGDFSQHYTSLVETTNGRTGTFAGDANLDGAVDVLNDAFSLIVNLDEASTSWSDADFNGDGLVDVLRDGFLLIGNLGNRNQ